VTVSSSGTLDRWGMRTTFVLALSASTVGMGNLWRFSYLSGEYGGGAFVITYVLCLFLIAVPVMVGEVVLGRCGGPSPAVAIRRACDDSLRSRAWTVVGALACLTGLLILSLYIVVAGWGMAYAGFMRAGIFSAARAVDAGVHFEYFLAEPIQQVYWQSLFLLLTAGTVVLGVRRGLGMLAWLAVPLLLSMLAFLIKFGFDNGDIGATGNFLFSTNLVDFSGRSALLALGHAFFTLGVGVGTGISYGAYAPERIPIGRSVLAVAVFDTIFAVLAGLAIFPLVFASNVEPAEGPGLFAALVWLLSLAIVTSFGSGTGLQWFGSHNLLGFLDTVTAGVLLPLVALLIALLVGWRLRPEIVRLVLARESDLYFSLWHFLLRYIAPPAIVLLMLAPFLVARLNL